ncbi:MAG: 4Fe-4S dicluster domain-containing protein [Gemmatimonadetes bacterium]|uniref:4Fe-4S dicluster domain-containing protein n=1 Tax=Candidatus Kutchimonas denitrificans TaxID=3056748 RepID=A0AAE5CB71_9BACT|nr:4Fe-4S dicluster domain-containing protein [Gemmatimonadota bacterium]NIR75437.1 4Fe-4S dicluster domain-containing protein [Candidatus Kutchimonas denitrificans]NIS01751.1 4Fe-4S dicluster domain-containing protein [Gemmatimonadota bacterium]NIT67533.1 4Fe-4S dicluster domain-containing protein [Gemmatimonadota bacterium]NIU53396.1 4Fe-4S dicluster domain-containing protein [Gemmatimonadota bacterium]
MAWLLLLPVALALGLLALWLVGERGHLMLPSTRAAFRGRGGAPGERDSDRPKRRFRDALHAYVYGRWPYQYIDFCVNALLPVMAAPGAKRWWADRYHGKVLPTELARRIITLDREIKRTDLERVIPYPTARDIVLKGPPAVTLLECPCRHARENPCGPTDVCMIVGDGSFTLEHHPQRSRSVTQAEALAVLEAEHRRGHVHTAYFKDAMDNRFYAICNCCRCCCGGLEAMIEHGVPMVASSGYVANVDEEACIACGDCEEACPFDAITVNARASVDWERCMGCGVCEGRCEMDAMTLTHDERKGLPLDVATLH